MTLGIIPSGNNLTSVAAALNRLGVNYEWVTDDKKLDQCTRVILPGVGAAGTAMKQLKEMGLIEPLRHFQRPLLGICIGMQLFFERSEEVFGKNEPIPLLGLIPGSVRKLANPMGERLPHMGWNQLDDGSYVYFVHSYCVPDGPWTLQRSQYGIKFPALIAWKNLHGMQFHPEKSGEVGARFLKQFLKKDAS